MRPTTEPSQTLSFEDALATLLREVTPLGREHVLLPDALGRALVEPIVSPVALPPWPNAGMDGYAVRREDVQSASAHAPVSLRVIGTIVAGSRPSELPALGARDSVRVMTGAPVPPSADAVVRVEDTDRGTASVTIYDARDLQGRGNIRPRGEDVADSERLFEIGTTLGPSHLGVLASVGRREVPVYRQPRVAVLCSGDELVLIDDFAAVLSGDRIVSSSTYALPALLQKAGAQVVVAPLVADTLDAMKTAMEDAVHAGCDVVITTGGVSVGAHDYTRDALLSLGGTIAFWRSRIRPGGPIGSGRIGDVHWLGLPGNPVSTMVTGALFAWPLLRRLGGHADHMTRDQSLPTVRVTMRDRYDTPAALTYFARVRLTRRVDGGMDAHLAGGQGSNLLRTMALADALLVIPERESAAEVGRDYEAILLP